MTLILEYKLLIIYTKLTVIKKDSFSLLWMILCSQTTFSIVLLPVRLSHKNHISFKKNNSDYKYAND